jgi:AcrR family transcriptional regulator
MYQTVHRDRKVTMTAKDRLLTAAATHIASSGVGDLTLRGLAAAIGTSHRMLIYHFGSKEGLLVEVIKLVEQRQRDALAEIEFGDDPTAAGITRAFWQRLSAPELAANERLFFEIYGQALQGRPGTTALLDGIVDSWIQPVVVLLERLGFPDEHAAAQARLGVAVTRGLLLDLLATGDRAGCDAAVEQYIRLGEALLSSEPHRIRRFGNLGVDAVLDEDPVPGEEHQQRPDLS